MYYIGATMTMNVSAEGQHWIAELSNCRQPLDDVKLLNKICIEAAKSGGATIMDSLSHTFSNGGVTYIMMLAESHISIHTWPEKCYAAVDVYTCGKANPKKILEKIARELEGFCFGYNYYRGEIRDDIFTVSHGADEIHQRFE